MRSRRLSDQADKYRGVAVGAGKDMGKAAVDCSKQDVKGEAKG